MSGVQTNFTIFLGIKKGEIPRFRAFTKNLTIFLSNALNNNNLIIIVVVLVEVTRLTCEYSLENNFKKYLKKKLGYDLFVSTN